MVFSHNALLAGNSLVIWKLLQHWRNIYILMMFWIFTNLVTSWRLTKESKQISYLGCSKCRLWQPYPFGRCSSMHLACAGILFRMQRLTLQVQLSNVARWSGREIWYCGWLIAKLYSIDWIMHLYSPITKKRRCAMLCTNLPPLLGVDHFPSFSFSKLSDKIRVSLNLNRLFLLFRLLARYPPFPTFPPLTHSLILLLV